MKSVLTFSFSFPFVGSKRDYFDDWKKYLPPKCTDIYEPFAGSATFTFQLLDHYQPKALPRICWGETDAGMRAIWETWGDDLVHDAIEEWKPQFMRAHLQTLIVIGGMPSRLMLGGKTVREGKGKKVVTRWTGADLVLRLFLRIVRDRLKTILNSHSAYPAVEVAAAYAMFKRFGHGSVMRTNNSGGLNVSLSVDKCKPTTIARWGLTYPALTKPKTLRLCRSAAAMQYRQRNTWKNSGIALIDSPYYVDRAFYRAITSCYPGHRPHDLETLQLCIDAIEAALKAKVGTIFITNYYCPALDEAIEALCWRYGRSLDASERGTLKKLVAGQGNYKHGDREVKNKKPEPIEWVWIIRRGIEQLNLLDRANLAASSPNAAK